MFAVTNGDLSVQHQQFYYLISFFEQFSDKLNHCKYLILLLFFLKKSTIKLTLLLWFSILPFAMVRTAAVAVPFNLLQNRFIASKKCAQNTQFYMATILSRMKMK